MTETKPAGVWQTLSAINCNEHTNKKGRFTYLSWTWAWSILMEHYPNASFVNHYNEAGYPCFLDHEGNAIVRVSVTVEGVTRTEDFAVTDNYNKSIKDPSSSDVNTALKRCMVKCLAYFGLGHYIYTGEDLPQGDDEDEVEVAIARQKKECAVARKTLKVMEKKKLTAKQRKALEAYINTCYDADIKLQQVLAYYKIDNLSEMTRVDAETALTKLEITV
jgi:hypothetical protein